MNRTNEHVNHGHPEIFNTKTTMTMKIVILKFLKGYKILGLFKLKAFADDKINVTQNIKYVFHKEENMVGKGENVGYQGCPLSHHVFYGLFS